MTDPATAFAHQGSVLAHVRSLAPSLLPAERAVAEVFLGRPADVIEMSSQQVADAAGASRATVVRTCQSLGLSGYQQLRVMLARDLGPAGRDAQPDPAAAATVAGTVLACFAGVGESLPAMTALLTESEITAAVTVLADARRLLVVGNGLSAPLAQLSAQRLGAIGRPAEAPTDSIAQQVAARQLGSDDALFVVSGSGANDATCRVGRSAREAGARVVLVTAFGRSPLTEIAGIVLVAGMRDPTFRDELAVTTRIPQLILIEGLVAGVALRLGAAAEAAHAATLAVLAENLSE